MVVIDAAESRNDLDFQTNLILSISNNTMAVDDRVVIDKSAALSLKFKRLK
jgi:hypothetical protein